MPPTQYYNFSLPQEPVRQKQEPLQKVAELLELERMLKSWDTKNHEINVNLRFPVLCQPITELAEFRLCKSALYFWDTNASRK